MRSYTNPVYDGYFADPFVFRCDGEYFAIGTGLAEARGEHGEQSSIFPLLRSRDLVRWRPAGSALVRPEPALGDTFWSPEIVYADGRFHLYYSVGFADERHQIRVATSDRPEGPYTDVAALTRVDEVRFAIDPHPFRDSDGRWYLFHARDFIDENADGEGSLRPGTALVVAPLESMTRLASDVRTVLRAHCDWQRFTAQRPMYGRVLDWHTLEGPSVVEHGGRYYCLYSGGCWQNETYGVDYATADHVLGPYESRGNEGGPRVLRTVPGKVLGPGHCSVFMAPDGKTRMLAYHAWDAGMTARRMCIDELRFEADGPRSTGPSASPRKVPSSGSATDARGHP